MVTQIPPKSKFHNPPVLLHRRNKPNVCHVTMTLLYSIVGTSFLLLLGSNNNNGLLQPCRAFVVPSSTPPATPAAGLRTKSSASALYQSDTTSTAASRSSTATCTNAASTRPLARSKGGGKVNNRVIDDMSPPSSTFRPSASTTTTGRVAFARLARLQRRVQESLSSSSKFAETNEYIASIVVDTVYKTVPRTFATSVAVLQSLLASFWWCLPLLLLSLVPCYTLAAYQTLPTTPEFWKLVNADHLWHSPDAAMVIGCFLGSNISYFLAGIYLLFKYPFAVKTTTTTITATPINPQKHMITSSSMVSTIPLLMWASAGWAVLQRLKRSSRNINADASFSHGSSTTAMAETITQEQEQRQLIPSRHTWLGLWTLMAGTVSTVFHAVQTYGEYHIAEGWCYLDHGVAMSAILYFWKTCGRPGIPASILSGLGLVALSFPSKPGSYAWLHSLWHVLSASAAVVWAVQGNKSTFRRAQLERYFLTIEKQQQA